MRMGIRTPRTAAAGRSRTLPRFPCLPSDRRSPVPHPMLRQARRARSGRMGNFPAGGREAGGSPHFPHPEREGSRSGPLGRRRIHREAIMEAPGPRTETPLASRAQRKLPPPSPCCSSGTAAGALCACWISRSADRLPAVPVLYIEKFFGKNAFCPLTAAARSIVKPSRPPAPRSRRSNRPRQPPAGRGSAEAAREGGAESPDRTATRRAAPRRADSFLGKNAFPP